MRPHSNADKLMLADLSGWQVVISKDQSPQDGDLKVFIPPDAVLTDDLAKELGVEKYLKSGNRVGVVRLRGEMSFGLAVDNKWGFASGQEVSERLEITKWEPPVKASGGDEDRPYPLFHTYTYIENIRNFRGIFQDGERVWITEKIHGTNCRVGVVRGVDGVMVDDVMIGSRTTRKRLGTGSVYERPLPGVLPLFGFLKRRYPGYNSIIVFGELYGGKIQDLNYGITDNRGIVFRVFDIAVDGVYISFEDVVVICVEWSVPVVPFRLGVFDWDAVMESASGNTILMGGECAYKRGRGGASI